MSTRPTSSTSELSVKTKFVVEEFFNHQPMENQTQLSINGVPEAHKTVTVDCEEKGNYVGVKKKVLIMIIFNFKI